VSVHAILEQIIRRAKGSGWKSEPEDACAREDSAGRCVTRGSYIGSRGWLARKGLSISKFRCCRRSRWLTAKCIRVDNSVFGEGSARNQVCEVVGQVVRVGWDEGGNSSDRGVSSDCS